MSVSHAGCECVFTQLTAKQGLNTQTKFMDMYKKLTAATKSGNAAAIPATFRAATLACKSEITAG